MTDEERQSLRKELAEIESRQDKGLTQAEVKRIIEIVIKLRPPLEDLCKKVSERQFMNMTDYINLSVKERLEFYHKHCKKD